MPEDLYEALRAEAVRLERPATELARAAIEGFLRERRRAAMIEAIARYASEASGGGADLDDALERAATEELLALEEEGS